MTSARSRLAAAALAMAVAAASLAVASPVLATTRGDGLRAAANEWRTCENHDPKIDCVPVAPVGGTNLLDSISDARADQMRDADKLEHDMDYVRNRLNKAGACWTSFGEIIAWRSGGAYSYDGTALQWWKSDPHRAIMTGAGFNAAGGSWATAADGGHYSVMIFAKLCAGELTKTSLLQPKRDYSPDRDMRFVRGEHTAYKLSSSGEVLDTKHVTFDRATGPESAGRSRVDGTAYLKVSSGDLAGWWVRESPRQYVRGMTQRKTYDAVRRVQIEAGTYTGYRFDSLGQVTESHSASISRDRRADVTARAIINGRAWFKVASGRWQGYWLRDSGEVDLVG